MASWWTLAFQAINFAVLVWLLQRLLYRPVLKTIAERTRRAEEAAARVTAAEHAGEQERVAIEGERARMTADGVRFVEEMRVKAAAERDEVLARARTLADELVDAGRRTLAQERAQALAILEARAGELAIATAARILEQLGSREIDEALLGKLADSLTDLPDDRLHDLRTEAGRGIEVVTAHELDPRATTGVCERLAARFGPSTRVTFRIEPSLVAGAELHFHASVMRMSWRDALARAGEVMTPDAVAR